MPNKHGSPIHRYRHYRASTVRFLRHRRDLHLRRNERNLVAFKEVVPQKVRAPVDVEVNPNRYSVFALLKSTDLYQKAAISYGEILIIQIDNLPGVLDKRHSTHQRRERLADRLSLHRREVGAKAFVIPKGPEVRCPLVDDKCFANLSFGGQKGRQSLLKGDAVIVRARRFLSDIGARRK